MEKIDLQIHTTASDGALTPREVVDLAIKKGMKAIAITDHDTISGVNEAVVYGKNKNIEIVPGVEISCREAQFNSGIDILGLFINLRSEKLNYFLEDFRQKRIKEKKQIIEKLNSLGYKITFEELLEEAGESLGRPHIAKILMRKYPNKFFTIGQVFNELIGSNGNAFIEREKISIRQAINIIKETGGISILAHPGRYGNESKLIIDKFAEEGGNGIETNYPYEKITGIKKDINIYFKKIAHEKGLLISGGSDFHGPERGSEMGDGGISYEGFDKLKNFLSRKNE